MPSAKPAPPPENVPPFLPRPRNQRGIRRRNEPAFPPSSRVAPVPSGQARGNVPPFLPSPRNQRGIRRRDEPVCPPPSPRVVRVPSGVKIPCHERERATVFAQPQESTGNGNATGNGNVPPFLSRPRNQRGIRRRDEPACHRQTYASFASLRCEDPGRATGKVPPFLPSRRNQRGIRRRDEPACPPPSLRVVRVPSGVKIPNSCSS